MKQTDIFLLKRLNYLIMCPLLKLVQGVQFDHFFLLFIQPSDFVIVDFENLLIHQPVQYRRGHISPLQQFFLRDFFRSSGS